MSRKKKRYDDDDGRTIADMSGVERRSPFAFHSTQEMRKGTPGADDSAASGPDYSEYYRRREEEMSKGESFHTIMGALGAGLLVAGIFIVVFAIVIILMLIFWK